MIKVEDRLPEATPHELTVESTQQRYSKRVADGVVKKLNLEKHGPFEASSTERMLEQL